MPPAMMPLPSGNQSYTPVDCNRQGPACHGVPPLAATTSRSQLPRSLARRNRIWRPSGDQCGALSRIPDGGSVRRRGATAAVVCT